MIVHTQNLEFCEAYRFAEIKGRQNKSRTPISIYRKPAATVHWIVIVKESSQIHLCVVCCRMKDWLIKETHRQVTKPCETSFSALTPGTMFEWIRVPKGFRMFPTEQKPCCRPRIPARFRSCFQRLQTDFKWIHPVGRLSCLSASLRRFVLTLQYGLFLPLYLYLARHFRFRRFLPSRHRQHPAFWSVEWLVIWK